MNKTVERLDRGCTAKVLHHTPTSVLLRAIWPVRHATDKKFQREKNGPAVNTVEVSREYFERKYGKVL